MSFDRQVLALAGVFQAARLVQVLARDGRCDEVAYQASIGSVFRIDADSVEGVFGGPQGVACGAKHLVEALDTARRDPELTRTVITILRLERRLRRHVSMNAALRDGVQQAARGADAMGLDSDTVSERLAELYSQTLSTLTPRVIVQGNGLYLSQARIVSRIRGLLLAAVRAAVLWRQMGGTQWGLFLYRRRYCEASRRLLASL